MDPLEPFALLDEHPSIAGAPRDPLAPTVHEKLLELKRAKVTIAQLHAESSAMSAKAQASLAKTTAIQQESALETQEKSVKRERLAYDTRRFVAGWGASNMGWDGTMVSVPGSAVIEDRTQLSITRNLLRGRTTGKLQGMFRLV